MIKKRYLYLILAVAVLLAADQAVKIWSLDVLRPQSTIDLIPGIFRLSYVENRGAAFGIFQGQTVLLAIFSVVITAALLYLYHRVPGGKGYRLLHVCYTLVLAGALGNQIDRIFRGFVVDMFEFYWFSFPVFNLADCFIVLGGVTLLILAVFRPKVLDPILSAKRTEERLDG